MLPAYLCSLGGYDNAAIVLTWLELLHVFIEDADLLLIVPPRWTINRVGVSEGL